MARKKSATIDLKVRMKEPLRAQIEKAAKQAGISMNAEIVGRLIGDDRYSVFFERDRGELVRLFAAAARTAELLGASKKSFRDDPDAYAIFECTVHEILERLRPQSPPGLSQELLRSIGKKVAEMHTKARSEEVARQLKPDLIGSRRKP